MPATPRRLTFGANADAYEAARPEWPAEAARWLAPGSPRLVVELGAGTGKLTRALAALGLRVVAVEPDARMLEVLREVGLDGVEAVQGEAEAIPLAAGEADAVVAGSSSYATIAGLPDEERRELRDRVARIVAEEPRLRCGDRLAFPFVVEAFRAVRIP